jgi:hypothetical protein
MQEAGGNNYYWAQYLPDAMQLETFLRATEKGGGPRNVTTRRHTIFERGQWVHVAWVWGKSSALYIDGKLGDQRPAPMEKPPVSAIREFLIGYDRPELNIDAAVDELRISDIERYLGEFAPPPRDREFSLDRHTRLLMHFNGNTNAESSGQAGPFPVKMTQ